MSKNIVLWDGTVVTVSDEEATQLAPRDYGRQETEREASATGARAALERDTTASDKAQAFVEGGLDTITAGGYGAAITNLADDESRFKYQRSAQAAPGYRFVGELAGMAVPTGAPAAAAKVGGAIRGALGAGRVGAVAGRFAEGALLGAGGKVAQTNVTGDPLSVEGLAEGAGIGGILNVGAGHLADRLRRSSGRAKEALAEAEKIARDTEVATANAKHFESDAGVNTAWKQFTTAVKVRRQAAESSMRQWEKQSELYNSFAGNNQRLTRAIEDAENTVRSVRQRYSPHPPAGQTPAGQHPGFDVSDLENAPGTKGLDVEWVDGKPRAIHYKWDADGNEAKILHTSKPPISDELDGRLRDYQGRISRVYQMKGGRTKLSGGKWAPPSASDASNPEAIMGELRSLYSDLQRDFPKAAAKLKPLPAPLAPAPTMPPAVELAPSFRAFVRQHPDTVARLANSMDDMTRAEFQRVTTELGVPAEAGVAEVHQSAKGWLSAMERLEAEAATKGEARGAKGFFELTRHFVRNAIRFKAGFGVAHAVGGPIGSALGVAASAAVGGAIDSVDNALVGGALLTAKTGVRSRIQSVVAEYGGQAAKGVERLGPVSAWLATSHFSGRKDEESDLRKRARNRIDEIRGAQLTGPDTAYAAVEGLLGHPSDVAFKVYSGVMAAINHLAQLAPTDPGLDIKMFSSNWTPSWRDSMTLAHRLEAVHAPLNSLARLMAGSGHPAAAETLWAVWPALMQESAAQVVEKASQGEYSTERAFAFSRIFRVPLTGFQNPVIVAALQGQTLPPPQSGGGGQSPRPTGRPPAVNSPIAGSNVGALLS